MITEKRKIAFWDKAKESDGCLVWAGYKTPKGYGKFNVGGKILRAHRVAYEITNGPIPEGIQIDHTCHNPSCIQPEHLRATTHKQNQENRRGAARNNRSGVRGVNWNEECKGWMARVTHNGQSMHLGTFKTIAEAEAVVVAKRRELFTHNDADYSRITDTGHASDVHAA